MKYLKLFESSKYYEIIKYSEFRTAMSNFIFTEERIDKYKPFSEIEIEKIKSIFEDMKLIVNFGGYFVELSQIYASDRNDKCINIYYLDDEWIYVEYTASKNFKYHDGRFAGGSFYYKCDQFEGLIQCLRDID